MSGRKWLNANETYEIFMNAELRSQENDSTYYWFMVNVYIDKSSTAQVRINL